MLGFAQLHNEDMRGSIKFTFRQTKANQGKPANRFYHWIGFAPFPDHSLQSSVLSIHERISSREDDCYVHFVSRQVQCKDAKKLGLDPIAVAISDKFWQLNCCQDFFWNIYWTVTLDITHRNEFTFQTPSTL